MVELAIHREGIEKFRKKLFKTGVAISLAASGFFLTIWGIAFAIDAMFAMRGLGFVLIGLLGVLTGAIRNRLHIGVGNHPVYIYGKMHMKIMTDTHY